MTLELSTLPTLNAFLNSASAALLATGYVYIRRGNRIAHRNCMIAAFVTSTVFLASYLIYHFSKTLGPTKFQGEGLVRPLYFVILITHTILAIVIVPMVFITLSRALRERFDPHRRIARWTLPIWMYVSVTGVVVYLMLYRLYPAQ
jgi:putative membrane protein